MPSISDFESHGRFGRFGNSAVGMYPFIINFFIQVTILSSLEYSFIRMYYVASGAHVCKCLR